MSGMSAVLWYINYPTTATTERKHIMAKASKRDDDAEELLGKKKGGKAAKPAAKSAKAAKPAKKASKKADDDDEETEGQGRKAKKAAKGNGKAAKGNGKAKPAASRGRGSDRPLVDAEDVRKALLKVKKPISYSAFADANEFNLRQVRRTARRLRDAEELTITHEGTEGMVSRAV